MVKNIKFRNVRSNFQSRLTNNITKINKSPNLFVPADKPFLQFGFQKKCNRTFEIHLVLQRFWYKSCYILENSLPRNTLPTRGQSMQPLSGKKYAILTANDDALLNKRTELINKCRHKNKYKLIKAKLKL